MVLRRNVFKNMTYAGWVGGNDCKVPDTWNLHTLLPKGLDHFIVYSSVFGGIGGTASVNYSGACAYQDALVYYRNKIGEKATTFNRWRFERQYCCQDCIAWYWIPGWNQAKRDVGFA